MSFIGRKSELRELRAWQEKKTATLIVIQGRRRIGKSTLVEEFAKGQKFYNITGIAPTPNTTDQMQRDEFARQLSKIFHIPKFSMDDWGSLFTFLAQQTVKGRCIILLDEISWMGSLDETFVGKLKTAWDTAFKKNDQLMLFLCGSVSSWIEENIISHTLFLGRPSLYINLPELSITECDEFWGKHRASISTYEKLKILSVTGGVPRYLEFINPNESAEENIKTMCFTPHSPLLNEFERIFSDIFGSRSDIYKKIIACLIDGPADQHTITIRCGRTKSGDFSAYLKDLCTAGFISRDYLWLLKNGKISKLSRYRLKDNYLRFYLKYIEPNKAKIEKNIFKEISITALPAWETMLALQFENLVLNNALLVIKAIGIPLEEVVFFNPFFQKAKPNEPGCQIDLLIQTKFQCLYICEIKFSKMKIGRTVIEEVEEKIKRLNKPRNFSCRTILIHVNGVKKTVIENDYFSKIIDFGQLL